MRRWLKIGATSGVVIAAGLVLLWIVASLRAREFTLHGARWELATEGQWIVFDNEPQLRAEHDAWSGGFSGHGGFEATAFGA
ncbi:MAG TPA: hypothetical protein VLJ39_10750, partial [Tepidisphaeraceae bacterium]|nr:hypothetical protein [Tepidisphaeraceae bacterium]